MRMATRAWRLVLAAIGMLLGAAFAQLPIPNRPPGFTYGGGSLLAGVQLETYVDVLCPDSKAALPALQQLASHYAPDQFRLNVVLFPLPYHQHAFIATESVFTITRALGQEQFALWLETLYANQHLFYNNPTEHKSAVDVVEMLFKLAQKTFPSLSRKQWEHGMNAHGGTFADEAARIAWKYASSRGKTGTPQYTLNGIPLDVGDDWTLNDWLKVIDPLVQANMAETSIDAQSTAKFSLQGVPELPDRYVRHFAAIDRTRALRSACEHMDQGAPCEYAAGRVMCCSAQEFCVLRVGCASL